MSWKSVLYDWGGLNGALFQFINEATPPILMPLAWLFSNVLGNYWTAPLVLLTLWAWSRSTVVTGRALAIRRQLLQFVISFGIAFAITSILKLWLDFPRPAAVFGQLDHVLGTVEAHYSLPSGHSTYAALVVGALWPLAGVRQRMVLVAYVVLVGWSRIAAGMHFPADVLAGWGIASGSLVFAGSLLTMLPVAGRLTVLRAAGIWYGLAAAVLLGDQFAKAVVSLLYGYGDQVAVTSFFNLVHFRNNGAAFSLLAGAGDWARFGFAALALGVSLWLIRLLRQGVSKWEGVGYCLILGGALGNAVDRLLRGAVVDFLDFHWQGAHWPAFNLADVAIAFGAACLLAAAMHQGKAVASDSGHQ
ncbi:MAG: signal peptidase II [Burkholderiaceae bacterium]|jgi:signal peptidase II|uniref:Lipoprotein signal peptidase n=2 Tax=Acidovorax carolinensis TaxID=553814 RepID=A0A240UCD4_9BURK|nr:MULTISPECIES: signal peptidase II [Acidovorax]MDO8775621.1 signal peptidase II [Burkholderiaceae bacterium]ART47949.1 signal peptidase II [Acidovorax carolinensis]ART51494.1 signal peptidase II [Acidovorax carolinensis]ART55397.1 signal peptidase II [Acidovorax carolinensis]ART58776.1 signal peptidase II [Acidovorax carolinensis]